MVSAIIFREGAEVELREAFTWYEAREMGLGTDFMRCVDGCLQMIRRYPLIFPVVHHQIRMGVIRRFPYSIFYLPTAEAIIVLSVFHASRQPLRWIRNAG